MKTINELKKELDKAKNQLARHKHEEKKYTEELYAIIDEMHKGKTNNAEWERLKAKRESITVKQLNGINKNINILKAMIKIINNNIRVTVFEDVKPHLIDMLKKYEGKQAGEKTRKRFCDDVKALTNYRCYILHNSITIYYEEYRNIEIYSDKWDENNQFRVGFFDSNNKFVANDNMYIYDGSYIDDIPKFITEQQKTLDEAMQKMQEAEELFQKLNSYHIDGIEPIYIHNLRSTNNRIYGDN
jgi:hypothetical protein